jgi:acetyl esterase/lipase
MLRAPHLEIERGRVYSEPDGSRLRLDIYRPDPSIPPAAGSLPERRPAIIQVHGGGWLSGSRLEQGIPLLNHMAALGWVGFNIDYRLSPRATWPDHIVDVKRAIAWVREHAAELAVDPERIAITGGSAGGHLTALAGLSVNDPAFQPGFERADTSLLAAVPFYGVYDLTNSAGHYYPELRDWAFEQVVIKLPLEGNREIYERASPRFRVHPGAPPFMIIHGERDTLTPVADARDFVMALQRMSRSEVRYIELPGAEHAFDLWPSVRTARVVDAIGRFLGAAVAGGGGPRSERVGTAA